MSGVLGVLMADNAAAAGGSTTAFNPSFKGTDVTLTNSNLTFNLNGVATFELAEAVSGQSSGKFYFEVTINSLVGGVAKIGVASSSIAKSGTQLGATTDSIGYTSNSGIVSSGGASILTAATSTTGNVIGVAIDLTASLIWVRVNGGNWNNDVIGNQNPVGNVGGADYLHTGGTVIFGGVLGFPAVMATGFGGLDQMTANFGGSAYGASAPSGYGNW